MSSVCTSHILLETLQNPTKKFSSGVKIEFSDSMVDAGLGIYFLAFDTTLASSSGIFEICRN